MFNRFAMFLGLALSLGAANAATYTEKLGLDDLSAQADRIIVGTVSNTYPVKRGGLIYTAADISVNTTLKGDTKSMVHVEVPGGRYRGEITKVEGSPEFIVNDQVLIYMSGETTVGLGQGVFVVEAGIAFRRKHDDVFVSPSRHHDWADEIDPGAHYDYATMARVRAAAR
jgi:hypothetical protein